jgi:hypothetical protein
LTTEINEVNEMAKEITDAQELRKLKRDTKILVRRHMDTMAQLDILIDVVEHLIETFCPGDEWADVPIRQQADTAIVNARRGIDA